MIELWIDKWRPKTLDQYIWQDDQTHRQVKAWIEAGSTDNVLLTGPPGTGKTSLTGVLMNELGVEPDDILAINASHEGNVEVMKERVYNFVTTGGWNGMKYVILDEADGASQAAQMTLKSMMEEHSQHVRFILTGNMKNRILPPIQDRCIKIELRKPDEEQFAARMVHILQAENVDFETSEGLDALDTLIKTHYPSLRACIRDLQRYSLSGRLERPHGDLGESGDWRFEMVDLFKAGKIRAARELICRSARKEEIGEVFVWLYNNSSLFANEDEAILVVADHLYRSTFVADPEINLSACLIRLAQVGPAPTTGA